MLTGITSTPSDGATAWMAANMARSKGLAGIAKDRHARHARRNLLEQLQPFSGHAEFVRHEAGGVAARPRQAVDKAGADRIDAEREHDRHGAGRLQQRPWSNAISEDDVGRERGQFRRVSANFCSVRRPAESIRSHPPGHEQPTEIRKHATELAALAPDVILAVTSTSGPCWRQPAPCRSCSRSAPIRSALASSTAWRGRAATSLVSAYEFSIGGKWLELLKQIAPGVTRVAVLRDASQASAMSMFAAIQAVAPRWGGGDPGQHARCRARSSSRSRVSRALRMAV